MLSIKYSHQVQHLAQDLMRMLSQGSADPLQPTPIVVQSNGMSQWLKMQIADQQGICANIQFPFASSYLWRIIRQSSSLQIPALTAFDKPVLVWRLLALFQDNDTLQRWPVLQHYVSSQHQSPQAQYHFAYQLADVYDQYQLYRPEWIRAWRQGDFTALHEYPDDLWQAQLWQWLNGEDYLSYENSHDGSKKSDPKSRTDWLLELPNILPELAAENKLPTQLFLFGISSLPPIVLQLYQALAQYCDITLYLLNPSEMYWGDQLSTKEAKRVAEQEGSNIDDLLATQNPLLASMGRLGRDFIDQLLETTDMIPLAESEPDPRFEPNPVEIDLPLFASAAAESSSDTSSDTSLLGCIQQQILYAAPPTDFPFSSDGQDDDCPLDNSVVISSSYTPKREVEVLHDQIADWLNTGEYQPTDILVMTPDIQTYGPLAQRHFSQATPYIPYSVADRGNGVQLSLSALLLDLFALVNKRCNISELLKILEQPVVMARFELDLGMIEQLRQSVDNMGIRWGMSKAHVQQFSLNNGRHTWSTGLQKVMLQSVYSNDVSLDNALHSTEFADGYARSFDSSAEQSFAKFWIFFQIIDRFVYQALQTQTPERWVEMSRDLISSLIVMDDDMRHVHENLMNQLAQIAEAIAVAENWLTSLTVDVNVMAAYLEQMLPDNEGKQGFLSGGVTIGAMVPMRSIPFKIIAFLGLNDGIFPRQHQSADFDLSQRQYRLGDRNRRSDDRYMFLEALMATQEKLYLSYNGREPIKNQHKPPSPIVTEFMAVMAQTMNQPLNIVRDIYVNETTLQAYSASNFKPDESKANALLSYNTRALQMAKSLGASFRDRKDNAEDQDRWLLESGSLEATSETNQDSIAEIIDLAQLQRFWLKPANVWLSTALGGAIPRQDESSPTAELFELSPLQKYQQRYLLKEVTEQQALLAIANTEHDETDFALMPKIMALLNAHNVVPEGMLGAKLEQALGQGWEGIADEIAQLGRVNQQAARVQLSWTNSTHTTHGASQSAIVPATITLNAEGELLSFASVRGGDLDFRAIISAWVNHVYVNVWQMQKGMHSKPSHLITLSPMHEAAPVSVYNFLPIEKPRPVLHALLEDYISGQKQLLPWLPDASRYAYQKQDAEDDKTSQKMDTAIQKSWHEKWQYDDVLQLLYPDTDIVESALFTELAVKHMAPLFAHCPELEGAK